jgi:hypothetical protein
MNIYMGRSMLDAATLDKFHCITPDQWKEELTAVLDECDPPVDIHFIMSQPHNPHPGFVFVRTASTYGKGGE